MKKILAMGLIIVFVAVYISANASETYENFTLEELLILRDELSQQLKEINQKIAAKQSEKRSNEENSAVLVSLSGKRKITDIFPDEELAVTIRNTLKKLSIDEEVSQEDLDTIQVLELGFGNNVSDLTGISYLHNLKELSIFRQNNITSLPSEVTLLKNLRRLSTTLTPITELPDDISALDSLEELSISFSPVSRLPDSFWTITSIKKLCIGSTNISEIPDEISNLVNLEELDATGLDLIRISDHIGDLAKLRFLTFSSSKMPGLPDSIGNLISLRELYLHECNITELPESIGNLVNLRKLDLSKTDLIKLPETVYALENCTIDIKGSKIK